MSITPTPLKFSQSEYENLRYALLKQVEGAIPTPYFDSKDIVTIGVGFNIDAGNGTTRNRVMGAMNLTAQQQAAVKKKQKGSETNSF